MDFATSSNGESLHTFIQKEGDSEKYDLIFKKLCGKRNLLEDTLRTTDLSTEEREAKALDLVQIKEDMLVFGISEIDYQGYLAKREESTPTLPFL